MTTLNKLRAEMSKATSSVSETISDLRARIRAKQRELRQAETAAVPRVEASARIRALVQRTGDRYIADSAHQVKTSLVGYKRGGVKLPEGIDSFAAVCAMDEERAVQMLEVLIDRVGYVEGPSSDERERIIAELASELAELDSIEVSMVDEANDAGLSIDYRPETVERRKAEAVAAKRAADAAEAARAREAYVNNL